MGFSGEQVYSLMISSFTLQVMAFKSQPISSREDYAFTVSGVHRVLVRN